ncbi:hypothetical protein EV361DRAFT_108562 [Lentinula raphanica]|nr:hypothetical protein F5880DRAFT_1610271 [Lentinula raphanica]KAJ3972851.1 hypothetical protein EV361DRAFT_108562 [Lentinula raphanica]
MAPESSVNFQPAIPALNLLRARAERKDDPLAPYASAVLNIVSTYTKDSPTGVKNLVKAVYEFGVKIVQDNGKPTSDDLYHLRYIEGLIKANSSDQHLVAKAGLWSNLFRLESKIKLEGLSRPSPFLQGLYQPRFYACIFNHANGNIDTTTNTDSSSYLNCNNTVVSSEITYDKVDINVCRPRSDAPDLSPLTPIGDGLGPESNTLDPHSNTHSPYSGAFASSSPLQGQDDAADTTLFSPLQSPGDTVGLPINHNTVDVYSEAKHQPKAAHPTLRLQPIDTGFNDQSSFTPLSPSARPSPILIASACLVRSPTTPIQHVTPSPTSPQHGKRSLHRRENSDDLRRSLLRRSVEIKHLAPIEEPTGSFASFLFSLAPGFALRPNLMSVCHVSENIYRQFLFTWTAFKLSCQSSGLAFQPQAR